MERNTANVRNLVAPRWARISLGLLTALALVGCSDDTVKLQPDQRPKTIDASVDLARADLGLKTEGFKSDAVKPDSQATHKALKLTVAHVNDTHSQIEPRTINLTFKVNSVDEKISVPVGGYARLATKVKALQQAGGNLLFLHAGDAVQGSLYFVKYLGIADAELFNLMKLDAQAVGNHEFDKGSQVLADYIAKAAFPILAGNVDASQDALLKDKLKPYIIKQIDGESVAIASLITPETAAISSPGPDLKFGDVVITAQALVKEIEGKGVNKIIFLTHLGYDADQALAKAVDGIDVIVGGHSHTLLGTFGLGLTPAAAYPLQAQSPKSGKVCIVQAWNAARVLGTLDVSLDAAGAVQSCGGKATLLVGDGLQQYNATTKLMEDVPAAKKADLLKQLTADFEVTTEDAAVVSKLNTDYKPQIDVLKKQKVATVAEDLLHVRVPGSTTSSGTVMPNGSTVAPLVAESMLWKANQVGQKAQLAVVNGGGVRVDLPAGDLTMGQIYSLVLGNTLFVLKLTGAEVRAALDAAVAKATSTGNNGGPFPYVAGIRYTADMNQPAGQLITKLEIRSGTSWQAIDPATTYTVVTASYLAGGGDYYDVFKSATSYRVDLGFVDAEVFAEWAAMKVTLNKSPADTGVTFVPKTP